jgi:hypothetical protein
VLIDLTVGQAQKLYVAFANRIEEWPDHRRGSPICTTDLLGAGHEVLASVALESPELVVAIERSIDRTDVARSLSLVSRGGLAQSWTSISWQERRRSASLAVASGVLVAISDTGRLWCADATRCTPIVECTDLLPASFAPTGVFAQDDGSFSVIGSPDQCIYRLIPK